MRLLELIDLMLRNRWRVMAFDSATHSLAHTTTTRETQQTKPTHIIIFAIYMHGLENCQYQMYDNVDT